MNRSIRFAPQLRLPSHAEQLRLFGEIDGIYVNIGRGMSRKFGASLHVTLQLAGRSILVLCDHSLHRGEGCGISRGGLAMAYANEMQAVRSRDRRRRAGDHAK